MVCHADSGGGLKRTASHKDGEPAEEALLLFCQQVIAPLEGVAQRLLAGGQIACATGEDIQAAREAFEQRLWREQFDTSCRQLNGQWQTVQPRTDLGDGASIGLG